MARAQPVVIVAAAAVALALAGVAPAGGPIVRRTTADQAAARAAVLKSADLGGGWKGSVQAVAKPEPISCPGFAPKQSDLVVTGAAFSAWSKDAMHVSTEVEVLEAATMVRLDWARTIRPQLVPCLARSYASALGPRRLQVLSAARVAFPRVGDRSAAYRIVLAAPTTNGTVRIVTDLLLVAKGRSEATLAFIAPQQLVKEMTAAERRLAVKVAGRLPG